jgi:putative glutamine amidotransferase
MIVGITMRLAPAEYGEQRDAIAHDWFGRLQPFGITVLPIPNILEDAANYARRFEVSRLLLSGGDDLGPLRGEPGGPTPTPRDRTEFALMDWAFAEGIPILAVCRGLQVANVYFGGGLTRNLVMEVPGECHRATSHTVYLEDGDTIQVNSFHNEGVLAHQVAPNFNVFARSAGGVVEGLTHQTKLLTAIQWHPERLSPCFDFDNALLTRWLEKP